MSHLTSKDFQHRPTVLQGQRDNIMKGLYGDNFFDKTISNDEIKKGDIDYAFSSSDNQIKFSKKGEELIKLLNEKKESLQERYNQFEAEKAAFKIKLTELGVTFMQEAGQDYDYAQCTDDMNDDCRSLCYKYNEISYPCRRIKDEIKTINTLLESFEPKKNYSLTVRQLSSLQKSLKFDIVRKTEEEIVNK